jgi:hypothetical protein
LVARIEASVGGYPGDVVVASGWGEYRNQTLVIDVTINNALAPSREGRGCAEQMEVQKLRTPMGRFCTARSDVFQFLPFAIEVHGRIGPLALGFIRQLSALVDNAGPSLDSDKCIAWSFYLGLSRAVVIGEDYLLACAQCKLFGGPPPPLPSLAAPDWHDVSLHGPPAHFHPFVDLADQGDLGGLEATATLL